MSQLKIARVSALPTPLVANTIYLLQVSDSELQVVTVGNTAADVRSSIIGTDVDGKITASVGALNTTLSQAIADAIVTASNDATAKAAAAQAAAASDARTMAAAALAAANTYTDDRRNGLVETTTGPGGVVRFPAEIESAIAAIGGTSGLEFQATATHLQWRTSDVPWTNLVSLADIGGTDFTTIQWRVSATHLQWMYDGVTWVDVVPLSSLGVSGGGGQTTVVEGAGILVSASGSAYTVSNNDRGSAAVAGHEAATNPHSQYALTTHTHTGYAPTSHTHTIANVSGLQSALDAKQGSIVVSSIAPSNPVEGQLWVQVA